VAVDVKPVKKPVDHRRQNYGNRDDENQARIQGSGLRA
jgi:hypothetical protein